MKSCHVTQLTDRQWAAVASVTASSQVVSGSSMMLSMCTGVTGVYVCRVVGDSLHHQSTRSSELSGVGVGMASRLSDSSSDSSDSDTSASDTSE